MAESNGSGLLARINKYLNGHKTSALSILGGILVFVFSLGGTFYTLRTEVNQVKAEIGRYKEQKDNYVSRRELTLSLEPMKQNISNIREKLDHLDDKQSHQNEQILRELRRLNRDG